MKIRNINIKIHWSWWIFVVVFLLSGLHPFDFSIILQNIFRICMFFVIILGHEFSHSLVAEYFGHYTKSITMNVFGGVAHIDMRNIKPEEDFLISLAGPVFNLFFFLISFSFFMLNINHWMFFENETDGYQITIAGYELLYFSVINVLMGILNLFPAYPMDGGRILRAILSLFKVNSKISLNISNFISLLFAAMLIAFAIFTHSILTGLLSLVFVFVVFVERTNLNKIK